MLRRPGIGLRDLVALGPGISAFSKDVAYQVELDVKYRGYMDRQR